MCSRQPDIKERRVNSKCDKKVKKPKMCGCTSPRWLYTPTLPKIILMVEYKVCLLYENHMRDPIGKKSYAMVIITDSCTYILTV